MPTTKDKTTGFTVAYEILSTFWDRYEQGEVLKTWPIDQATEQLLKEEVIKTQKMNYDYDKADDTTL